MMDWEGLATLHIVEQQDIEIKIERGESEIQIDTKIHSMEWLVATTDAKPLWGHVWTPTKNDVLWYQETVVPNT